MLEEKLSEGGVEISFRVSQKNYDIIKYACDHGFEEGAFEIETVIRYLLHSEIAYLRYESGEVEKFRWNLFMQGKDPNINLRESNPELYEYKRGIFSDKKIPTFLPQLKRVGR